VYVRVCKECFVYEDGIGVCVFVDSWEIKSFGRNLHIGRHLCLWASLGESHFHHCKNTHTHTHTVTKKQSSL